MKWLTTLCITAFIGLPMVFVLPPKAEAFPFGGQASFVAPCYNQAIYAVLGPPRGGAFVWTPQTKTYPFGPPRHAGQWMLGLAGANYFCILNLFPIDVRSGSHMMMMGSSR